jgi:hypothetical protein
MLASYSASRLAPHSSDLTKLELGEAQAAPALRRAHESAEHQFEHGLLTEAVGDDLEPPMTR